MTGSQAAENKVGDVWGADRDEERRANAEMRATTCHLGETPKEKRPGDKEEEVVP